MNIVGLIRIGSGIVLMLLSGMGCASQLDSLKIDGTEFHLEECFLVYDQGAGIRRIDLKLEAPCVFATNADGSVRVEEYNEASVLLVESSKPHPEADQDPLLKNLCETRLLAVSIIRSRVHVANAPSSLLTCAPSDWDKKLFSFE